MTLSIDPKSSALVLIDLQKGILGRQVAPHSGADVLKRSVELANRFHAAGALVALVRVIFSSDFKDALRQPVDQPFAPPPGGFPPSFFELAEELANPANLVITKRQWGAFYGTDLDLQLRRRGIQTIVLGGIATNIGVESTARNAWEHGYNLIVAEDITSAPSAEMHEFAVKHIFPRLSRVVKSADVTFQS